MDYTVSVVLGDISKFLNSIFYDLTQMGINVKDYQIDHICYRVESLEDYEAKKAALSDFAEMIHEAPIGGRPISIFKLDRPITYKGYEIDLIELPAPKPGKSHRAGLEHVEFVIGDEFDTFTDKYNNLEFDMSGAQKKHNPEIGLHLSSYRVKFHEESLESIVNKEKLNIH